MESYTITIKESSQGYDQALANYRLGLNYSFVQQQDKAISAFAKVAKKHGALNVNLQEKIQG